MGTFFHLHKMWRHLFFVFADIFSCRYSMIITFLTIFIRTQPTAFLLRATARTNYLCGLCQADSCSTQVKNVGAVSFMQIELFLHRILTALKRFPKHKLIFMRTDLFSSKPGIDYKVHRIELCRRFNSKLLR